MQYVLDAVWMRSEASEMLLEASSIYTSPDVSSSLHPVWLAMAIQLQPLSSNIG